MATMDAIFDSFSDDTNSQEGLVHIPDYHTDSNEEVKLELT
jgi:hypothetical protein